MLRSLIVSLVSTLLIELPVLYILGVRARRDILTATYANVLTNPPVVFAANLLFVFAPAWGILVLEIGAFLTEGFIFKHRLTYRALSPWALAFVANLISFETGIVLTYFRILG